MTSLKELQAIAKGRGPEAKAARKAIMNGGSLINSGGRVRKGKRRNDPEAKEQKAYLGRLKWTKPDVYACTFSVPNERSLKGEAGRLKPLGVKSGIPDLLCILPPPSGRWRGMALEFKAPGRQGEHEGGRSPLQVEWGERFEVLAGWFYRVVYSADEAWAAMLQYMSNEEVIDR